MLEKLSREELIKKCLNQRNHIQELQDKITSLKKEVELKDVAMSKLKLNHKLDIYMQETLSYMEDIEYMKRKVKRLEEQLNDNKRD